MSRNALIRDYVHAYFRFRPDHATARAYPGFDDVPPSFDADALGAYRRSVAALRDRLAGSRSRSLSLDQSTDRAVLEGEIAMALFFVDGLGWLSRNPLLYVEAALDSIECLVLREELDPATRRDAMRRRLLGLEPLMAQLVAQVTEPMSPFVEVALELLQGAIGHVAESAAGAGAEHDAGLAEAADVARRAMHRAAEHLLRVAPDAREFEPMGEERYRFLLHNQHLMDEPSSALLALSRRTLDLAQRQLPAVIEAEQAIEIPPAPPGFGRQAVLDYYRDEVQAMRREVETRALVTIPPGSLALKETPAWLQAVLPGASYLPPPAFGTGRVGRFYVSPVPAEIDRDTREALHQLVALRRMRNLIVHEVYPGHHVQFLHAAGHPSAIRKIRDNDVMVEGWALYCEKLMLDEGLFDDVPSARPLRALRMRALRVEVDIGLHTGALDLDAAAALMCEHLGEGARGWVETEVRRYAAEPSQAMSYLVGREALLGLREEWRDARGPARFDLREFHDRFLAEGSIPIPLIRRKMLASA